MVKKDLFSLTADFEDNRLLSFLVGPNNQHLTELGQKTGLLISLRGNHITIAGESQDHVEALQKALNLAYDRASKGQPVDPDDIYTEFDFIKEQVPFSIAERGIRTKKKTIHPRNVRQADYIEAIQNHDLVFGIGPAGTGKTYLAVAAGVSLLVEGKIERIILSRPAVEAGEKLGFLPGNMREKVDPYLRPLYDAIHDMMPADQVAKRIENGEIEVAPLAFMRGRTLSNAFVILDEAQNTTPVQMKMFLTRLGNNSRMVITGDLSQIDLPSGVLSGLKDAVRTLMGVDGISFITFKETDVVRHPLVTQIVHAYDLRKRLNYVSDGDY